MKQKRDREELRQKIEINSKSTYSIPSGNAEAEEILKSRVRSEDPMSQILAPKTESSKNHRAKRANSNRFDIKPGLRWDGVDRSNGYEKRIMSIENEKNARIENQYRTEFDL